MMANVCGHDDSVECYAWQKLTNEDKRYAATHLNETDEARENAVANIKRWIEESDESVLYARIGKYDGSI